MKFRIANEDLLRQRIFDDLVTSFAIAPGSLKDCDSP